MTCDLYWNTHKRLFSVRHKGKVIAHTEKAFVYEPQFVVSEAGRQRVLREGVKNVHAVVRGHFVMPAGPEVGPAEVARKKESWDAACHDFLVKDRVNSDYSFAVYDPRDECGLFRVLCVLGDIVITDRFAPYIKMVRAYVHDGKPQLKVKMTGDD